MLRRAMMAGVFGGETPVPVPSANVSSLLQFNGSDGSTTFTDETGKVWTASGNAQIDTASNKWGGASGTFDGTGDYISTPSHAGFGFGTGDFTIAGWAIRSVAAGDKCLFDNRGASNQGIGIYLNATSYPNKLTAFNNSALIAQSTNSLPSTVWFHWAVTRQGTTLRGFIDGALEFTATDSRTYASSATPYIGANYLGTQAFEGNADSTIILKGLALYTAAFTPPAGPYALG